MKKLMKVRMINWHLFSDVTMEIKNNVVITGENGSGKSTLLDAMQYVLTAGKAKFNGAANDLGKRTLDTYIRGKLGREGKEFLRDGDVITYIILEYYDEQCEMSQLIGVVFELSSGGIRKETFFHIRNQQIEDELFYNKNNILNRSEFKKNLNKLKIKADFADKKSDSANLIRQALGVTSKYFDMIPRALAFKPINQVYNFIFDFLLNEDRVNIDELRNNIRAYRNLNTILEEQNRKLKSLEVIENCYDAYDKANQEFKQLTGAITSITYDQLIHNQEECENRIEKNQISLKVIENKLINLGNDKDKAYKDKVNLENSLSGNDTYQQIRRLEYDVENLESRYNNLSVDYNHYIHQLKDETNLLKKLRIKDKFIDAVKNNAYNTDFLNDNLYEIRNDLDNKYDESSNQIRSIQITLESQMQEQMELNKNYKTLSKNKFYYKTEVYNLISILKKELNHIYGKDIEVRPLCEYLEIEDESCRNAIEGYLNTQRFDIILDPEYFKDSVRIYDKHKGELGLYGTAIVDTEKLFKYQKEEENTLATKVSSVNSYAKRYANMLLNRVTLVDDLNDLTNYKRAITKSCMLYSNYKVMAISPMIYKKPFIGLKALEIQKKQIKSRIDELTPVIKANQDKARDLHKTIQLIRESQAGVLLSRTNIIDEFRNLEKNLNDTKKQLKELKKNSSVLTLMKQLDNLEQKYQSILKEYRENETLRNEYSMSVQLAIKEKEKIEEELSQFDMHKIVDSDEVNKIKNMYLKKYSNNYNQILNLLENRIKETSYKVNTNINNLEHAMIVFNHDFKMGYEEKLSGYDQYRNEYYKLRDIEIIKRQEEVRSAKTKCEQSFQESFISRLNEKIVKAKKEIKELNIGLEDKNFNGDNYQFEVNPSKRKEYKQYYDIISSNQQYNQDNLFTTQLSQENRVIMDELFNQIALLGDQDNGEKLLEKYTDYREYLDYDIRITHENGDITKFSKVNKEKSGGETQTPFYVVIASSFEQMIKERRNEDSGCVVLFDEAFNNMDETRIEAMMRFYNELNVQVILAVPPTRASTITPYVDTTLMVIKQNDSSFIEGIINDD